MKKLGPLLAIFSGIITLVVSVLSLLIAEKLIPNDIIKNISWLTEFKDSYLNSYGISVTIIYSIMIGVSVLEIAFGIFAFKKSRGFSAFILLAMFATITALSIVSGVREANWTASVIINISINGLAAVGLLFGFMPKSKS